MTSEELAEIEKDTRAHPQIDDVSRETILDLIEEVRRHDRVYVLALMEMREGCRLGCMSGGLMDRVERILIRDAEARHETCASCDGPLDECRDAICQECK